MIERLLNCCIFRAYINWPPCIIIQTMWNSLLEVRWRPLYPVPSWALHSCAFLLNNSTGREKETDSSLKTARRIRASH